MPRVDKSGEENEIFERLELEGEKSISVFAQKKLCLSLWSLLRQASFNMQMSCSRLRDASHLSMRGTCHIGSVDLDDLVSRLETTILGDETLGIDLLDDHTSLQK